MIYDAFLFFNELDVLELRLNELASVVDYFVIVESARTFSNRPKPLFFAHNRERFKAFADRIRHVVVDDLDGVDVANPWSIEAFLRRCLARGLDGAQPRDVVLLSDVDEIPRAELVREHCRTGGVKLFEQRLSYYYVNCTANSWHGTRMFHWRDISVLGTDMHGVRFSSGTVIPAGGWHFSYLGGADHIRAKLDASAHQDLNKAEFHAEDHIQRCRSNGNDLFGRADGPHFTFVPLDGTFPRYLLANVERFSHLIAPPPQEHRLP